MCLHDPSFLSSRNVCWCPGRYSLRDPNELERRGQSALLRRKVAEIEIVIAAAASQFRQVLGDMNETVTEYLAESDNGESETEI